MPPKTRRQARYLWSQKPGVMRSWRRKYGKKGVKPTGGRKKRRRRRRR